MTQIVCAFQMGTVLATSGVVCGVAAGRVTLACIRCGQPTPLFAEPRPVRHPYHAGCGDPGPYCPAFRGRSGPGRPHPPRNLNRAGPRPGSGFFKVLSAHVSRHAEYAPKLSMARVAVQVRCIGLAFLRSARLRSSADMRAINTAAIGMHVPGKAELLDLMCRARQFSRRMSAAAALERRAGT